MKSKIKCITCRKEFDLQKILDKLFQKGCDGFKIKCKKCSKVNTVYQQIDSSFILG